MKIEERKETKEELSKEQKDNLFTSIIMGNDVTETIKTSRGNFKIKYPRMADIHQIGRLQALRLNGIPVDCFDKNILWLIQQIATLDVLVLEGPAWFENAKKENTNFTWADIPLQSFIQEVYALVSGFRVKVQNMLSGNKGKGDNRMVTAENSKSDDSNGLFNGLTTKG